MANQSLVIQGPLDDEGECLFWSNVDGWVSLSSATVFDEIPTSMPLEAQHILALPKGF